MEIEKHYLYVPYAYKEEAKNLNTKYDGIEKKWYTTESNRFMQECIDRYHSDNFVTNYHGTFFKSRITTQTDRDAAEKASRIQHDEERAKYIKKYGNDKGFGCWYSVNILHHD